MPNIFRKLTVVLLLALLGLGLLASGTAQAQGGDCGGYGECIDSSTFDTDIDGWNVLNNQTIIQWQTYMSKTTSVWIWWPPGWSTQHTDANGVMEAYFLGDPLQTGLDPSGTQFQKTINFDSPGTYKVVFRAAHETEQSAFLSVVFPDVGGTTNTGLASSQIEISGGFNIYQSPEFQVNWPSAASLSFFVSPDWPPEMFWLDFVYVVKVSDAYSTLPAGTGTPMPMATQIPLGTPFCNPVASQTPTAPAPDYLLTPAPTQTPIAIDTNEFAKLDTFTGGVGNEWTRLVGMTNEDMDWTELRNHTLQLGPGAMRLRNDADGTPSLAMVYAFAEAVTTTTYIDGWAMSDPVQTGVSAYIEIWYERADTNAWVLVDDFQISHFNWYPFHAVISPTGGINTIFIKAHRSDDQTTTYVYLDDLYLYNNLTFAPNCDGTYGYFVTRQIINAATAGGVNDPNTYSLLYPYDKPCPPAILEPNNFWGPLLSQLTIFVDELFAFAPIHEAGIYPELFRSIVLSPVGTIFVFLTILFDWTYPLYVLGVLFAVQTGRLFLILYLIIKRMIPGAG